MRNKTYDAIHLDFKMAIVVEDLQINMHLQAIDECGIWRDVSVVHIDEAVKINWRGFSKKYDCAVELDTLRYPVEERLLSRNAISAEKFHNIRHPKNLSRGDAIFDSGRMESAVVEINDPFRCEIRTRSDTTVLYENMRESVLPVDSDPSDENDDDDAGEEHASIESAQNSQEGEVINTLSMVDAIFGSNLDQLLPKIPGYLESSVAKEDERRKEKEANTMPVTSVENSHEASPQDHRHNELMALVRSLQSTVVTLVSTVNVVHDDLSIQSSKMDEMKNLLKIIVTMN